MQTCIIISSDNTNKKKKTRIGAFFFLQFPTFEDACHFHM